MTVLGNVFQRDFVTGRNIRLCRELKLAAGYGLPFCNRGQCNGNIIQRGYTKQFSHLIHSFLLVFRRGNDEERLLSCHDREFPGVLRQRMLQVRESLSDPVRRRLHL